MHVYAEFVLYSPSHTLSPLTGTNPPERTCSALLFCELIKENIFACLRYKEFPYDMSIYIIT
jgi:hypothetical protein